MDDMQPVKYLYLLLFAFLIVPLQAQKNSFAQGYVISLEGDTLEGWVKDRSSEPFVDLYLKIRFRPENAWLRKKYGPDDIRGYGYGDQSFESVPVREESAFFKFRYYLDENNKRVFLKVISRNEPLTWYHWEYVDDESSYVDYIPLFYKSPGAEMVRVTQGILGLKRNRLMEYFRDCPDLVNAIRKKQVNDITEVYYFYLDHCLDH